MTTATVSKESQQAIEYFEGKLSFEMGPYALNQELSGKKALQIIDLRTPEEYNQGHIPGAINILYDDLAANLSKLAKDKTTVVYCYDFACQLSTRAALLLAQKGYRVKELIGGFEEWLNYELPVEGKAKASSCCASKSPCS